MRVRSVLLSLCVTVAAYLALVFIPLMLRTEETTKAVAEQMLKEEFARLGVFEEAFEFLSAHKHGFDWIVTWRSKSVQSAHVGVTITLFDIDVWGVPDCKGDPGRTVNTFGEVC